MFFGSRHEARRTGEQQTNVCATAMAGARVSGGHEMPDAQREQWQATFRANPDMYGTDPSEPGAYAAGLFAREQVRGLLELGAGQGRDTLAFLRAALTVTLLDYAAGALTRLQRVATDAGLADRLTTVVHDVREPLPLPDGGFDAVYSPHAVQHGAHHRRARNA